MKINMNIDNKYLSVFVSVLAFIICYPVVFLVLGSIMSRDELFYNLSPIIYNINGEYPDWSILPKFPSIRSYVETLFDRPDFLNSFWNSIKIASSVVVGQLVIGIPAAWGFAQYEFKFKNFLFSLYIILMLLPFQVLMLSEYLVLNSLSLVDSLLSIILPGVFATFPVFIMRNFFMRIPSAIIESARVDGASELYIFVHIGMPLGLAGIIASSVLQFIEYWNLVEQPIIFLESKQLWTLTQYLPSINILDISIIFTASVISLIPTVLIFISSQEYLQSGIAATAMKE